MPDFKHKPPGVETWWFFFAHLGGYDEQMCGRFQFVPKGHALLMDEFGLPEEPDFPQHINLAPTQEVPVVLHDGVSSEFRLMHWGLIPTWMEMGKQPYGFINARVETAKNKPSFRDAWRQRRCLVLSSGYYEWQNRGGAPTLVQAHDQSVFAFAGLWEPGNQNLDNAAPTCTILTTEACDDLLDLHPRMPVMLAADQYLAWLQEGVPGFSLTNNARSGFGLTRRLVSKRLNSVRHEDAKCLFADEEPPSLFA